MRGSSVESYFKRVGLPGRAGEGGVIKQPGWRSQVYWVRSISSLEINRLVLLREIGTGFTAPHC